MSFREVAHLKVLARTLTHARAHTHTDTNAHFAMHGYSQLADALTRATDAFGGGVAQTKALIETFVPKTGSLANYCPPESVSLARRSLRLGDPSVYLHRSGPIAAKLAKLCDRELLPIVQPDKVRVNDGLCGCVCGWMRGWMGVGVCARTFRARAIGAEGFAWLWLDECCEGCLVASAKQSSLNQPLLGTHATH